MRVAFETDAKTSKQLVATSLQGHIEKFGMIRLNSMMQTIVREFLIMVSKFDHVLLHLLYQVRIGWLKADVVAVVSNHEASGQALQIEGIPFIHMPVTKMNKIEQEKRLLELIESQGSI